MIHKSQTAKKAECLYVNIKSLIERVGFENCGFVTLTFADDVQEFREAGRRFNSLQTNFLRPRGLESIAVPERQGSGRFHFHLFSAFPCDIRTGFDFTTYNASKAAQALGNYDESKRLERIYFQSANGELHRFWADLLAASDRYGFGRCHTLPILSNAEACARYVGGYVKSAVGGRLPADKGMRTVRYALRQRAATIKFSWADGNGLVWRRGLQLLGMIFEMEYEDIQNKLGFWKYRKLIRDLGENFEKCLVVVADIPDWAGLGERIKFTQWLHFNLTGETNEAYVFQQDNGGKDFRVGPPTDNPF